GLSDRAAAAAPPRSLVPPASKPVAPAAITDAFYAQQKQPKPKMGRQLPLRQEEVAKPVQAPVLIVDDEAVIPISARVTLMDLRESSCRWPMGDPQSDEFRFCGGKAVIGGGPYCAYHARVAYVPMAARRKQFSNEPRANMRASHVKRGSTAWGDG
ncbi:MAG: hypothetical protein KGZ68_10940, partial [Dechloromonas sp.]|nr:hypothetical protein [Dechloromonas sp.]